MSVTYPYFLWRWRRTRPELPGMGKVEKLSSWQRKIQMIRKYKTEVYVSNLDRKTRIIKSLTKTTNTVNKTGFGVHFRAQQACTVDVSKKTNICDLTWRVASVPTWPFSDPMNPNELQCVRCVHLIPVCTVAYVSRLPVYCSRTRSPHTTEAFLGLTPSLHLSSSLLLRHF